VYSFLLLLPEIVLLAGTVNIRHLRLVPVLFVIVILHINDVTLLSLSQQKDDVKCYHAPDRVSLSKQKDAVIIMHQIGSLSSSSQSPMIDDLIIVILATDDVPMIILSIGVIIIVILAIDNVSIITLAPKLRD
jgi:hypothetical protein